MRVPVTIITMLIVLSGAAQDSSLFKYSQFISNGDTLNYRLMYPDRYDVNKKYPVVLFLHGVGERGTDNEAQLKWGGTLFSDSTNRTKFPAFVIFPQCANDDFWANMSMDNSKKDSLGVFEYHSNRPFNPSLGLVSKLIDSFARTAQVDSSRIYLGGLSMGGMGTFELLWRKPKFFAAAIAICGGGDPGQVKRYANKFPIWIFHGSSDPIVPTSGSRLMVKSLKAAGAKVTYTEYPGVGHDSWKNAFKEPTLLDWLFAQKK